MDREGWIRWLLDGYKSYRGMYLDDSDCKELMDLLKEEN